MRTLLPSPFMTFRCVLRCMWSSLPSRWVQSTTVLRTRDLWRSNSVGLISFRHKHITDLVFLAGQHPFTLYDPWLMKSPLKCLYKIRLLCFSLIKSLGTGIITWSKLYSMVFLHVINFFPKLFLGREVKAILADLATYPSLTSFPCSKLTWQPDWLQPVTVWNSSLWRFRRWHKVKVTVELSGNSLLLLLSGYEWLLMVPNIYLHRNGRCCLK